jgi:molecular chaperone GrpE
MTKQDGQDRPYDEGQDSERITGAPLEGEMRKEATGAGEKRVEEAQAEAEKYRDQLLRKAAEFENYKRRSEADWQNLQRYANERVLLAFLPILDDFTRSLKSGAEQKSFEGFYRGVEMIAEKFLQTLKAQGIEPLEAVGKPFSVDEHDALLQVPRAGVPPRTVIEEVEKGYRLGDRVLRHAKVIVSADEGSPGRDGRQQGGPHDQA